MKRTGYLGMLVGLVLTTLLFAQSMAREEEQAAAASTGRVVTQSKFYPTGLWPLERGTNEFVLSLNEHQLDPGAAYVYIHQTEGAGRTYRLPERVEGYKWQPGYEGDRGNLLMFHVEDSFWNDDGVTSAVLLMKGSWDDVSDVFLATRERLPNVDDEAPLACIPSISSERKFLATSGFGVMTFDDEEHWGGPSDFYFREELNFTSGFEWKPYLIIRRLEDLTEHDFEGIDLVSDLAWEEEDRSVSGLSWVPIDWSAMAEDEVPSFLVEFFTVNLENMTITRERVPLPGNVGMIRSRKAVTFVDLRGEAAGQRFLLYPESRQIARLPDLPEGEQSRYWHFYADERFAHLVDSESGSLLELVEEGRVVLQRAEPDGAKIEDMLVSPDGERILWLRKRFTLKKLWCGDEFDVVVEDLESGRKETIWQYSCNVSSHLVLRRCPSYVWSRDSTKVFLLDYRTKEVNHLYVYDGFLLREFLVDKP